MFRLFGIIGLAIAPSLMAASGGGIAEKEAWEAIDHTLQHGDVDERRQALAALATVEGSNQGAVERVEGALHDKATLVRQSAALALGQMKARSAIPALKAALDDTGEVAFAAAKSLLDMGDPAGQEMLVAVLSGDRKNTPGLATKALRDGKNRLKHPQGLILMGVGDAAGTMFGPPAGMGFGAARDAIDLKGHGVPGRAAAAAYLAKDPDPYAVTLLEWALSDDNQFVRLEAAKGLGERGNADSIGKLQVLLHDDHNKVRCMAAASIVRLAARTAVSSAQGSSPR